MWQFVEIFIFLFNIFRKALRAKPITFSFSFILFRSSYNKMQVKKPAGGWAGVLLSLTPGEELVTIFLTPWERVIPGAARVGRLRP